MRREAERLGMTGWVRNAPDGSVGAVVQGQDTAVDTLFAWAQVGPPQARVDRIEIEPVKTNGLFSGSRSGSVRQTLNKSSPRQCEVVTALAVYNRGLPLAGKSRGPGA